MSPIPTPPHQILLQPLSDRLLWLEVQRTKEALQLMGAGAEPYIRSEEDETLSESERLHNALERILEDLNIGWLTNHDVTLIVPNNRLTARHTQTPPTDEENIDELIEFEVCETLQLEPEQICWDTILSPLQKEAREKQLLWVATRQDHISKMLSAFPATTLKPTQATTDFSGLYSFLLHHAVDRLRQPVLFVIEAGAVATLLAADQNAIYFVRSLRLPGEAGSEDAALKERRAEQLATEINRTLSYAGQRLPSSVHEIIFAGFDDLPLDSIPTMPGSDAYNLTRLTVDDVVQAIEFGETADGLNEMHLSLLTQAYCRHRLHEPGIDLLPRIEESPAWGQELLETLQPSKTFMTYVGAMLGAILVLWIAGSFWYQSAITIRLQQSQDLIEVADQLQKEEAGLRQFIRNDPRLADLLFFLTENLPEGIFVKNFQIDDDNQFELSLYGGNNQQFMQIIQEMNESSHFRDVITDRAAMEERGIVVYINGKIQTGSVSSS